LSSRFAGTATAASGRADGVADGWAEDVPEVSGAERSRLKTRRNSLITGMGYLENRGGQTPAIVAEG